MSGKTEYHQKGAGRKLGMDAVKDEKRKVYGQEKVSCPNCHFSGFLHGGQIFFTISVTSAAECFAASASKVG